MNMMQKIVRPVMTSMAVVGFTLTGLAVPAQAQDDYGCHDYAWSACSYDENGNPTQVSFECYDEKYNECIRYYEGW